MKNFRVIFAYSVVLSILLVCFTSCGYVTPTDNSTNASEFNTSNTNTPVVKDTEPLYIIPPTAPDDDNITTEYSMFRKSSTVIAEFGEPLMSDDGSLLTFTGESESTERNFAIFPIKIHKKFEATAYSDESFFDTQAMIDKEELGTDRTQTYLNFVLDYPNKDKIMSQYDDVILIESKYAADVVPGEKYFLVLFFGHIDYSHLLWDEYECETATGWMPVGNRRTNKPDLIPVRDDKICLPDDYFNEDPTREDCFVSRLADMTWYANTMLTHFGLNDWHFRDGMTIDELEKFFEYETDELLYGVFFRETDTQAP